MSEDATPAPAGTPAEAAAEVAAKVARLFRREVLVSDAALRIDAAARVDRGVVGNEDTVLEEARIHVRGDANEHYGDRARRVAGSYERSVARNDTFLVGDRYEERIEGGVEYRARREAQAIVGGAYAGVLAGPCLRLSGMVDYLAWGAWIEADAARVEIAGVMARSHLVYCHLAGARVVRATSLIDDFATRIETFGAGSDAYGTAIHIGAPGSGVTLDT